MKALTLHQPWATLIALGVKSIETRSWRAPASLIGQRIAIHAGAKRPPYPLPVDDGEQISSTHPLGDGRYSTGIYVLGLGGFDLPLGAIVATATLTDCVPMVDDGRARNCLDIRVGHPEVGAALRVDEPPELNHLGVPIPVRSTERRERITDVTDQLPYGDFAPGRWAWLLDDVKPTTERCPGCDGTGWTCRRFLPDGSVSMCEHRMHVGCSTCDGAGRCEPIPAKGRQGLWEWTA